MRFKGSHTLFIIWNQVVASTTLLHNLWGGILHHSEQKHQESGMEKKSHAFLLSHRGNSSSSLTDLAGTYLNTHPQLLQQVNQKKGAVELCHTCISPSNMCSAVTGRNLATLIKYTEFSPGNLTLARPFKRDPEDPNCLTIHTKLLTLSFECTL